MKSFFLSSLLLLPLLACSTEEDDEKVLNLSFSTPEQVFTSPTTDQIEFSLALDEDTIYICWAQRRTGEATHDIYFSQATRGLSLETNGEQITNTAADSRSPKIALNSQGEVVILWTEGTSPSRAIQSVVREASANLFGPIGEFAPNTQDNQNPICHYDAADTLHVAWDAGGQIFYRRRADGGSAGAAQNLPMGTGSDASKPSIISGSNDQLVIAWEQTTQELRRHIRVTASEDGGLTFPHFGDLATPQLSLGLYEPQLATSTTSAESFFVIYRIGNANDRRIRISSMSSFGSQLLFSRDLFISDSGKGKTPQIQSVLSGSTASVYAAWENDGSIRFRASGNGAQDFGKESSISDAAGAAKSSLRPAMKVQDGEIYLIWDAEEETNNQQSAFLSMADLSP